MKIVLAIFIILSSFSCVLGQERTLEELHKDMELTSKHFSYGLEISESKVIQKPDESEEGFVDLESRYFDSVSTGAAGVSKRQRLR